MTARRDVVRALAVLPLLAAEAPARARDYADREELMAAVEALSAAVEARLRAVVRVVPRAAAFTRSVAADLARHRRERSTTRGAAAEVEDAASLPRLRAAVEELMHAHAEGLPAVDLAERARLAGHMIDLSRILTVVDLWMETEEME